MIPAYHDAITAVIFAMIAISSVSYSIGRDPDGETSGAAITIFVVTIALAVSYGVVWATSVKW